MQRKLLLLLMLVVCSSFHLIAQKTISGTVYDSDGIPLGGVNVLIKGTNSGTATDFEGNYQISASDNDILEFTYVGFKTREIRVGDQSVINVTMEEDFQSLDEVVVIGYGTQRRENISGSVSSIQSEEIEDIPQVSIDQLMQGRAAGVSITQNSGQPGSSVSVRIRGITSITGSNEPLYVIDGVPISGDATNSSTSGSSPVGSDGQQEVAVSPLASLNPSDVESIDILKDASATAIYGSRGANGVVIITTKKGKRGEGKFTYETQLSIQEPAKLIDVMELPEYAVLQNLFSDLTGIQPRLEFANPDLLGPGTNWQEEIFQRALMKKHQLSFSGASEDGDIDYYISAGYLDQQGTVIGSSFDRISLRSNVNAKLKDWVKVGASISASRTNQNITINGNRNGVVSLGLLQTPDIAVYNPDGSYAGPVRDDGLGSINPVALALSIDNKLKTDRLFGNVFAEFTLADGLSYRSEFGGDFTFNKNTRFTPTYQWGRYVNELATLNLRDERSSFWIMKNYFNYNKNFGGKHNLNLLLGHEAQESTWSGTLANAAGFLTNDIKTLNLGDADFASNDAYKGSQALQSFYARAIYNFDSRYGITAVIRADGSSKFDPLGENQWGYFPSISASWQLSNEKFMENFTALQNIKFKAGYGVVGNQNIPNYRYGASLVTFNTGLGTGFGISNIANSDLKWESSKQTNIGLEFDTFGNRLSTTIEVYDKTSKDFLYQLPLPEYLVGVAPWNGGVGAPFVNLGEMRNRGLDVTLNYQTLNEGKFNWNSSLTLSHNKNEVMELLENFEILGETRLNSNTPAAVTKTEVGQPIGLYFGYKVKGIFNDEATIADQPEQFGTVFSPDGGETWLGDIQYEDINGDGVIDEQDRTVIGNPHPDIIFGFNNSFSYGPLSLSFFLQGSVGNDLMNLTRLNASTLNRRNTNQVEEAANYWTPENRDTNIPRPVPGDTYNNEISDRWIEDGSYLRIQNVSLGYTLPHKYAEKIGIDVLKLYGSIQNLYTFTDYKGFDPEVGSFNQDVLLTGVDNGRYPSPRTFTLGLNLQF
ncbi:TonB-dependent receptor [Galbibacter sp. EGI 63066]|uniref:SusC/RagA family TonB-linked outer membrane protein n=1 Tax=Galbibacter sp. EGI 63066 TaxID=2993559 RepID=UPI0022495157|nr:TonB-dependent receptor [Galbibacter sp. EGI 63066]MCX2678607.1 TonB-dependent receptor [Galbibacter sp. EGI 63066]